MDQDAAISKLVDRPSLADTARLLLRRMLLCNSGVIAQVWKLFEAAKAPSADDAAHVRGGAIAFLQVRPDNVRDCTACWPACSAGPFASACGSLRFPGAGGVGACSPAGDN